MRTSNAFAHSKADTQSLAIPAHPLPSAFPPRVSSTGTHSWRGAATPPWWLWWNILSLDAPAVAVIWAAVFARAAGIATRASDEIVLGLAVGIIYIADRLLDGWRPTVGATLQERHIFYARHRTAMLAVLVVASAAILCIAVRDLSAREAMAGLALAATVAAYIVGIHASRGFQARLLPKEFAVGILFAAGTTLPLWSQATALSRSVWLSMILFALLCSLNCLAIEYWESRRSADAPAKRLSRTGNHIYWFSAALATASLAFLLAGDFRILGKLKVAISLAAFLLFFLHLFRDRFSRPALRVLADAVLVAAGLFALLLQL